MADGAKETVRNAAPVRPLARRRAKDALKKIKTMVPEPGEQAQYGNYVSYVKALPATIIMSGLGQALAMEKAGANKSGDVKAGHERLYRHLNNWLCNAGGTGWTSSPYSGDVLEAITDGNDADYIRAQAEALEYLEWLKKFAMAFLEEKQDREGE